MSRYTSKGVPVTMTIYPMTRCLVYFLYGRLTLVFNFKSLRLDLKNNNLSINGLFFSEKQEQMQEYIM